MIELLPEGVSAWLAVVLVAASIVASAISAATSLGGGSIMLAVLALIVPQPTLVPIHGVLQLGSNLSRFWFMRAHVPAGVGFPLFAAGCLAGAALGGLTAVHVPQGLMIAALALFILWSVWGTMPAVMQRAGMLSGGLVSGAITMFVGATGPFVAALLRTRIHERMAFIAVHSACMSIQHTFKLAVFGALGFAYGPYVALIMAMVAGSILGSYLGRHVLVRLGDVRFQWLLKSILTVIALRLLWTSIDGLGVVL